jgi:hypothetical protein
VTRRATLALAGLLAALPVLAGLSGCETRARGDLLAEKLRGSVAEKLGELSSLTCPDRIAIQASVTTFPCDVLLADGNRGTITVTLDGEGALSWKAERGHANE